MLRVLLVDDEPPARRRLRKLLTPMVDAGRLSISGEAGDGIEALAQLKGGDIDLVFLDIRMPACDGFGVVERLHPEDRPVVVFTTAYDEYAIQAFEANAIDYLLKPIDKDRLAQAVARAERVHQKPEAQQAVDARISKLIDWIDAQAEQPQAAQAPAPAEYIKQLSIPYRDRILIVPADRLVSVEIIEGITRIHMLEPSEERGRHRLRQHVANYTLEQLDTHLNPEHFMRVHRSAIVAIDHIREMIPWFSGRYKLMLTGEHEVIASRERSKLLKERLMI